MVPLAPGGVDVVWFVGRKQIRGHRLPKQQTQTHSLCRDSLSDLFSPLLSPIALIPRRHRDRLPGPWFLLVTHTPARACAYTTYPRGFQTPQLAAYVHPQP